MNSAAIYSDHLVSITDDQMIFKQYYFPTMREKIVRLVDIENVSVQPLTIRNGKLRLHGTGNIKTWYPKDSSRPGRDKVFFATLKNQWINIGFTVENSNRVEKILRDKKLLKTG